MGRIAYAPILIFYRGTATWVDARLQKNATASDVSTLDTDLSGIDRQISLFGIPKGHSDLYFR